MESRGRVDFSPPATIRPAREDRNVAIDGKGVTAAALVVLTRPRAPLHAVSGPHRYGAAHPRASRIPDGRERARATLTPSP